MSLGSDFDGSAPHHELCGLQKLPRLYSELSRRGIKPADLDNVMGDSVARLLAQVLPGGPQLD